MLIPPQTPTSLSLVPTCYHHLQEVFNKSKALSLSPHQPYDCAIELIPCFTIPKGHLYSVSGPEREAKGDIETSLKAGLFWPSSSPACAGFFFVKKDGTLRPRVEYSPLNNIIIKNCYPLPLMSPVLTTFRRLRC